MDILFNRRGGREGGRVELSVKQLGAKCRQRGGGGEEEVEGGGMVQ